MKDQTLPAIVEAISSKYFERYKSIFHRSMTHTQKKNLIFSLEEAYVRERLIVKFNSSGKLLYYAHFLCSFMGEFDELFLHIPSLYCVEDIKIRKQFYKEIQKKAEEIKILQKVKRILIEVSVEDETSKKYFLKKGFLTYIELVGKTSECLKNLKSLNSINSEFSISKLQSKDINKLIDLDLEAHLSDKSSRMRGPFMKADAKEKMLRPFYKALLTRGTCYVAKIKNRPVGDIGFFINKEYRWGLIACIFVAKDFQNKGVSKLLYKKVLEDFQKIKLQYFIGSTTTKGVLRSANSMGRRESKSSFIVKI